MKISVVVPVYNAERYIRSAVESALSQPETGEVVLVEDKSPDNCLAICQALAKESDRVKLYQHPNGENRGAGASRNLGIEKSAFDYIAFLDADDYFLPARFSKAAAILSSDPSIDGVYEAAGAEFENEEARSRYLRTHAEEIATVCRRIPPEDLFHALIEGGAGYIHLDGLVVKRESLIRVGMFPQLRLHQDLVLTTKLAALCKLVPGNIETPVAIRRLHLDNRITNPKTNFFATRTAAAEHLYQWAVEQGVDPAQCAVLRRKYHWFKYKNSRQEKKYFSAFYHLLLQKVTV